MRVTISVYYGPGSDTLGVIGGNLDALMFFEGAADSGLVGRERLLWGAWPRSVS